MYLHIRNIWIEAFEMNCNIWNPCQLKYFSKTRFLFFDSINSNSLFAPMCSPDTQIALQISRFNSCIYIKTQSSLNHYKRAHTIRFTVIYEMTLCMGIIYLSNSSSEWHATRISVSHIVHLAIYQSYCSNWI